MAETSGNFKPVSQLKTAEDLSAQLAFLKQRRGRKEIDWRLNLAYYRGQQFAYWNPAGRRVETLPTEDGEKPRYRVRMVSNQILPGSQSLLSKIVRTKPIFAATPGEPGDDAIKAAQFSEGLLEMWWRDLNLAEKYKEAVLWSFHCGDGYWSVDWDALANKPMKFILGPDGVPIVDDGLATEFEAQLSQHGIQPQEKVVYMGDLKVEVRSPFHVFGDPTKSDAHEWKWVIVQHNLDPDDVKARFGKDIKPDAQAASPDQALPFGNSEEGANPNVVRVYCLWVLPQPGVPKGRYCVWTESGGKQILHDAAWPWPDLPMLPVVQFKGVKIPGIAEGEALTTQARPLQKQLNRMLSQIQEYFNLTVKPQWLAPYNSMRERVTNEPGVVHEYNPVGATNLKPEPVQIQGLPSFVFELLGDVGNRLNSIYGLTDVTEGQLPPNLEAADAIDLLQEMAVDKFAPTIESNEHTLARAGQIMLNLAQKYYSEPRLLVVQGFGGAGSVKQFSQADFSGSINVHVEAGSSMPKTRAERRNQIAQWINMGLLDPKKAWKYYDIADIKDLAIEFAADEDHALREHDKLIQGVPLNPEAVQAAAAQVNRQINPDTGQPIQSPQEAQQILQNAALQPMLVEDLTVHMDTHAKYMKSMAFESLPGDVRQRFITHYQLTLQRYFSLPHLPAEVAPPKVNLQIRSDVGASTVAAILQRAGVPDADAQTIASEPPLENWVSDSVDDPDADAAGPGQEGNQLSDAAKTMLEAHTANANAQLSNSMDVNSHTVDVHSKLQDMKHQEDMHQQTLRKAQADAALAEKKARESSFKPKPAAPKKPKGSRG